MAFEDLKIRQCGKCTSAKYHYRNKFYVDDQIIALASKQQFLGAGMWPACGQTGWHL
jgi:hypothetical protein